MLHKQLGMLEVPLFPEHTPAPSPALADASADASADEEASDHESEISTPDLAIHEDSGAEIWHGYFDVEGGTGANDDGDLLCWGAIAGEAPGERREVSIGVLHNNGVPSRKHDSNSPTTI